MSVVLLQVTVWFGSQVGEITETKNAVRTFRFHAPILSFGEPGSIPIVSMYGIYLPPFSIFFTIKQTTIHVGIDVQTLGRYIRKQSSHGWIRHGLDGLDGFKTLPVIKL